MALSSDAALDSVIARMFQLKAISSDAAWDSVIDSIILSSDAVWDSNDAEVEELHNIVAEFFSMPPLISTGTNASGNHQFQTENNGNNPVSPPVGFPCFRFCPPVGFPRKARSKRSRRVRFRSTAHPWICQVEELNINQSAIQPLSTMLEGERLGQALSVEVINSSTHNEYESLRIGQPESSPPHEGLENKGDTSQQLGCIFKLLFEDGTEQDQHVLQMDKSDSTINYNEETVTREMSKRTPENAAEIIHLDEFEDETPVKYIEPQSLTTQPKRSKQILEDEGNTVEIEHLALETTSEVATKDKEHITAAERDVLVEELPVEDVGYAMTTSSQPSTFQTMKSVPQQEVEEETMALGIVAQKLMLEDVLQKQNKGIIEKVDTTIHFVSETCIEDTSEREKKSEKDISFESLREHFGRSLDDAANSFGVSRSTLKRICRSLGIKRWQYGKRRMDGKISSSLRRRLNDTVPHTSQDLNKMTVKATYNGVTIRFELPGSSGIAELQDHVRERLHLERESFSIKYQDDEGDWVLIACDKDVQECMEISRSSNKTIIKMLLDPPINHHVL